MTTMATDDDDAVTAMTAPPVTLEPGQRHHRLKFTVNAKNEKAEVDPFKALYNVIQALSKFDDEMTVYDVKGHKFDYNDIKAYDVKRMESDFGMVNRGGKIPSVLLGFNVISKHRLGFIKRNILSTLKMNNVYLNVNSFDDWHLDTVNLAFVYKRHPRNTDKKLFAVTLKDDFSEATASLMDCSEFAKYKINGVYSIPDINVISSNIIGSENNVKSEGLEIHVKREDADFFKALLPFLKNNSDYCVISRDIRFKHPTRYDLFLNQQNIFLESHRNIKIEGLSTECMNSKVTFDNSEYATVKDYLLSLSSIDAINATYYTDDTGRWNISTTVDKWTSAKQAIDEFIAMMISKIEFVSDEFPKLNRIYHRSSSSATVNSEVTNDTYLTNLSNNILGSSVSFDPLITNPRPRRTWRTQPIIVNDMNSLDAAQYPPLTQANNSNNSVQSPTNRSNATDYSPSAITLETMNSHLEQIKDEIKQEMRKEIADQMDSRLNKFEDRITSTLELAFTKLASVTNKSTSSDSEDESMMSTPPRKSSTSSSKLSSSFEQQLFSQLESISERLSKLESASQPPSPPHKLPRRNNSNDTHMQDE